jgi:hypothetical protein
MSDQLRARLKGWAARCPTTPSHVKIVWQSDRITPLERIGSHWRCRVVYGHHDFERQMTALIHKRKLRIL